MTEPRSDRVEPDPAELIDNMVPTRGYGLVPVVGIGGSAGSIEALKALFGAMPVDTGLAFVVVIHLSPEHDSVLAEVLQACTRMQVVQVHEATTIQADSVYVVPPGSSIRTVDGSIHLGALSQDRGRHVTVDNFFRALADTHGAHAAAVVLSGMDGDGALGIKRIKERGGLTVAQDPLEAVHDGMPTSAIATGMVDWVLPVAEMPARLQSYFRMEQALQLPEEEEPQSPDRLISAGSSSDEELLHEILSFMHARTGRDFGCYKRATVLRRIGRRMQVNGIDNLAAYLDCLRLRPGEAGALVQDLLISVTNFFRDSGCFDALASHIPALFDKKSHSDVVRVWVVATATGEEAYSLAMLLSEHAMTLQAPPLIQIFATDLDAEAIATARNGLYPASIRADVSPQRLRRFFVQEHHGYRVRRELREMVLFAAHDALKDSPFSRLDLVSCRNLLIYLNRDAQGRLFETFNFALLPQARLFLGASESMDEGSPLFSVIDKKNRLYRQRPAGRPVLPLPRGPGVLALALSAVRHDAHAGPVSAGRAFDHAAPPSAQLPELVGKGNWGDTHLRLLEHLSPPSILVDRNHDILHLSPRAGGFLQFSGGEPSTNLLRAVHPDLRLELRAALYQAAQSRSAVQVAPVVLQTGDTRESIAIRVVPAHDVGADYLLVVLESGDHAPGEVAVALRTGEEPIARHLDRELERMKSHLRDTVEQFEASTEELKSSNEELQAMNEELRSATEELETSREELQSINEELTTVNYELKGKVDELGLAHSDMHNLMDAAAIAIVFLDRELCITRYTPSAVRLFNLIPTDVGRPLSDLTTKLLFPELASDAKRVLERLVPVEREVGQSEGRWYVARLLPYRTREDDRIAGVVLAFIDITERKDAEEMRLWLAEVVAATADAIVSFSLDRKVISWNAGAEKMFGHSAGQAVGQPLEMLDVSPGMPSTRLLDGLERAPGARRFQTGIRHADGQVVPVTVSVSPVRDGTSRLMAGAVIMQADPG